VLGVCADAGVKSRFSMRTDMRARRSHASHRRRFEYIRSCDVAVWFGGSLEANFVFAIRARRPDPLFSEDDFAMVIALLSLHRWFAIHARVQRRS
jgi:hypothetical protein